MSRSGYSDGIDEWALIRWRGAVNSAIRGRRGQEFLKEMLATLDAMPEKKLIAHELQAATGEVCAIGSVGAKRGIYMGDIDPENPHQIAEAFGIARAMVSEIEFINDDDWFDGGRETPEARFKRVREWVVENIKKEPNDG